MSQDEESDGGIDLSVPHLFRPHVRHFLPQPWKSPDGQPKIRIHDPLRLSSKQLIFAIDALQILTQFRGERTVDEIAEQFKIPMKKLGKLVGFLEDNYLLWGPTFASKERELKAHLDRSGVYPRGVAYSLGEDADEIRAKLDEWIDEVEDPELEAMPRGLVLPHLDYVRGWPLLATGYKALRDSEPPDRVVVLGSNHFGIGDGVIGTKWTWETPLGQVARDEALVEGLRERLGEKLFIDALDHISESSIQAHLPWIQHCMGAVPVSAALIPDPLVNMLEDDDERVGWEAFSIALKETIDELEGRTLIIASSDLSHVGPRFGEPAVVDDERREQVESHDRNMLALFLAGDAGGFVDALTWSKNPTRWCSIGNMAVLLEVLGPELQVELIDYRQACEDDGSWLISAAACAIL